MIVPRGLDNAPALEFITKHISRQLADREMKLRPEMVCNQDATIPPNVQILPQRQQLQHLHTIIRDKETSRHDFVFYAERLSRMVIERSLN